MSPSKITPSSPSLPYQKKHDSILSRIDTVLDSISEALQDSPPKDSK